jgi:hypothetical protein
MTAKKTTEKRAAKATPIAVVEEMFQWLAVLNGFDIRGFDSWHSSLQECGAKKELTERRALAVNAALENNSDGLLRHLEWMLLRWKEIRREDYVLPLARTGKKVISGAAEENMQRKADADDRRRDWQARAERKWADPQHSNKGTSEIARLIAKPGENPHTIRRRIKKPS